MTVSLEKHLPDCLIKELDQLGYLNERTVILHGLTEIRDDNGARFKEGLLQFSIQSVDSEVQIAMTHFLESGQTWRRNLSTNYVFKNKFIHYMFLSNNTAADTVEATFLPNQKTCTADTCDRIITWIKYYREPVPLFKLKIQSDTGA